MNKTGRHYTWCVEAYIWPFLPRHYEYPILKKLLQLQF